MVAQLERVWCDACGKYVGVRDTRPVPFTETFEPEFVVAGTVHRCRTRITVDRRDACVCPYCQKVLVPAEG